MKSKRDLLRSLIDKSVKVLGADGSYGIYVCDPTSSIAVKIEEVSDEMIRITNEHYIDVNWIAEIKIK